MPSIINREQDYAIRIVAYLSSRDAEPVSAKQIAQRIFVPLSSVSKIVHRLTKQEILTSLRGRNGGFQLRRSPDAITLLDVLTAMGFQLQLNDCTGDDHICPLGSLCKVHTFFMDEQQALSQRFAAQKMSQFAFSDNDIRNMTPS